MTIDQVPVSGRRAYLESADGLINLAEAADRRGNTAPVAERVALQVSGLSLLLEVDELQSLFPHQPEPLFRIGLEKEVFRGLIRDPYASRLHELAGRKCFTEGQLENMVVMDFKETPTLVSVGTGRASWVSALYRFADPVAIDIADIGWQLAVSKEAHEGAFKYWIRIETWKSGQDVSVPGEKTPPDDPPSNPHTPAAQRFLEDANLLEVAAYRLEFQASIHRDIALHEYVHGIPEQDPIGLPLLQGVFLRERIPSCYQFHSLHELAEMATTYHLLDQATSPPVRMLASLPFSALLSQGEAVTLTVPDGRIKRLEAWLNSTEIMRPPKVQREE